MNATTNQAAILCGIDDSTGAREAVIGAAALAERIGAPLISVHVAPSRSVLSVPDLVADMIVTGSRGRGSVAAALLGSVSRELISISPCPVMVTPPGAAAPARRRPSDGLRATSVVCGIDGSAESRYAAEAASQLAWRMNNRLVLAHAYPPATSYGDRAFRRQLSPGPLLAQWRAGLQQLNEAAAALTSLPEPELGLEPGDPAAELLRVAKRERAELLVVGSHGHGRVEAALYGSVALTLPARRPSRCWWCRRPPGCARARTMSTRPRSYAVCGRRAGTNEAMVIAGVALHLRCAALRRRSLTR